jgi:Protein of unknown function (DUF3397)
MTVLGNLWSFVWAALTYVWGVLTVLPFLGFPLAYLIVQAWKRDRRLAGRWAVNITNFLFIRAVVAAYTVIWPAALSAWWWVTGFFLVTVGLLSWLQVKWKGKLSLRKAGFSAWRLSFPLFGLVYVVLFAMGIVKTMSLV